LLNYDSDAGKNLIPFDAFLGSAYFGGTYDETTQQYAFRITKYIQNVIYQGSENYKLNLVVIPPATRLSRSQFYGTNPANPADVDKRIKLRINYTLINK